ncbi:MAG: ribosomal-processing cysteine protease Prp [Clostridia bacterium]|nr:ribosomal-processing cysteine protease Prp [Clostridia bacterium]
MTSVIFSRDSFGFVGFSVSGHSGYAEEGSDIVCSAISSCCELVLNQLCDSFGYNIDVTIDPKRTYIGCDSRNVCQCKESRQIVSGIIDGFYRTVSDISKQYPRFVKCTITEV